MESFILLYFSTVDIPEDYNTDIDDVKVRLIYISPNFKACSHLGYKVEGVAFYANSWAMFLLIG